MCAMGLITRKIVIFDVNAKWIVALEQKAMVYLEPFNVMIILTKRKIVLT